jgi:predicted cupin superfamily sugar epimerase
MTEAARELIATLKLDPLPAEGGFFRQTWRSETSSAILFLLTPAGFSALHRLDREELWHFHAGDPVEHVQLDPRDGRRRITRLGAEVRTGLTPQVAVFAGVWQGARLDPARTAAGYALLGCTVTPPWDDGGFELGGREALAAAFPGERPWIEALTR